MQNNGYLLILLLILGIGFNACSDNEEPDDENLIVLEGIVRIQDTFEIREGKELLIKPGAEITFSPGAIFVDFKGISKCRKT